MNMKSETRYEKYGLGGDTMNRRKFLKLSAAGAMGLTAGVPYCFPNNSFAGNTTGGESLNSREPDLEIRLTAVKERVSILSGEKTIVWRYTGDVLKGAPSRLQPVNESYLGPTIHARKHEHVRVHFENRIPEPSNIHWHGLHVPESADGHPRLAIDEGRTYTYDFKVTDRAGTYWYHPHPHGRTGAQAYAGMAGLFLVSDDQSTQIGLPTGETDVPLVIQDRVFNHNNQLIYMARGHMEAMTGVLGNRILVNGRPDFTLPVATRPYRFRVLNGSNSRIYKLAWSDGHPLVVLGTDGGLLEKPETRRALFLAPGERLDLWMDFSRFRIGDFTSLISLPFEKLAGRPWGNVPPNGARLTLAGFRIARNEKSDLTLPALLSTHTIPDPLNAVNVHNPKRFRFSMQHMRGTINGRVFQMEAVTADERVELGTDEIWEFENVGFRGMMGMMGTQPHPLHIHGLQFRILSRKTVVHDGYLDSGWKDTVLLFPGESVRLHLRFTDYPGLFLYHCHNLEHEDNGMMRNYHVRETT